MITVKYEVEGGKALPAGAEMYVQWFQDFKDESNWTPYCVQKVTLNAGKSSGTLAIMGQQWVDGSGLWGMGIDSVLVVTFNNSNVKCKSGSISGKTVTYTLTVS